MTPEDIKNLPTPETDAFVALGPLCTDDASEYDVLKIRDLLARNRSLEQQRDFLRMALENAAVQLDFSATGKGVVARNESFDKARDIIDSALASIRQMKEGK